MSVKQRQVFTIPEIKPISSEDFNKIPFSGTEKNEKRSISKEEAFAIAPPKYSVNFGGKTIYMSELFHYERQNYPLIFAYVKGTTGELEPRLLYYSNSRAIWRVAPGTLGKTFNKGQLDFTCDLPPELNLALMQKFNEASDENSTSNKINEDFVERFANASADQYVTETKKTMAPILMLKLKTENIPDFKTSENEVKAALQKAKDGNGDLPDFSKVLFELVVPNEFYTKAFCPDTKNSQQETPNFYLFAVPSENGELFYLYASVATTRPENKDQQRITFLLTASKNPGEINSFCVANDPVNLGYTTCYPIVHAKDEAVVFYLRDQKEIPPTGVIDPQSSDDYVFFDAVSTSLPLNRVAEIKTLKQQPIAVDNSNPSITSSFSMFESRANTTSKEKQLDDALKAKEFLSTLNAKLENAVNDLKRKTRNKSALAYKSLVTQLEGTTSLLDMTSSIASKINLFIEAQISSPTSLTAPNWSEEIVALLSQQFKVPKDITSAIEEALPQLISKVSSHDHKMT